MNVISSDTAAKLQKQASNPAIAPLHAHFAPIRAAYATAYKTWMAHNSRYNAATQRIDEMLSQLSSTVIEDWDVRIMNLHKSRTARYKELMPNGRTAFMTGGKDQRIAIVAALAENLEGEPALNTLQSEVQEFHDLLSAARDEQQGLEGDVATLSSALEHERLKAAAGLYFVMGGLMQIHCDEPREIEKFFDLENIRQRKGKTEYVDPSVVLQVGPNSSSESGLTLSPDTRFLLRVTGEAALKVCLTTDPTSTCPDGEGQSLNPGEELDATPASLGKPEATFLVISNPHATAQGEVQVYLL
jgi:hypothetical protein